MDVYSWAKAAQQPPCFFCFGHILNSSGDVRPVDHLWDKATRWADRVLGDEQGMMDMWALQIFRPEDKYSGVCIHYIFLPIRSITHTYFAQTAESVDISSSLTLAPTVRHQTVKQVTPGKSFPSHVIKISNDGVMYPGRSGLDSHVLPRGRNISSISNYSFANMLLAATHTKQAPPAILARIFHVRPGNFSLTLCYSKNHAPLTSTW